MTPIKLQEWLDFIVFTSIPKRIKWIIKKLPILIILLIIAYIKKKINILLVAIYTIMFKLRC